MRIFSMLCAVVLLWCGSAEAATAKSVMCESRGAYRECRIGSAGTVRLIYELSDRACFEGVTWGTTSGGVVWVDRGCRAQFAVDAVSTGDTRIVCESQNGKRQVCPADTALGVAIAKQLSRTNCEAGISWGFDEHRHEIWVDDGCRAEFILGKLNKPPAAAALEGTVTCESENGRRKECAADTSAGVQLVRQLGDAACVYERDWGWDAKGVWVNKGCRAEFAVKAKKAAIARAVTCESKNGARAACPGETQFGVAIVKQLGPNHCILGETWGFDQDGIWVDKGCQAQFALGGYRLPASAVPATASRLKCESLDGKRNVCAVDTSRGVGLVTQISETNCVLNRNWGYDGEGIWVADGCRAEFVVAK
jgi:hypothetical protein